MAAAIGLGAVMPAARAAEPASAQSEAEPSDDGDGARLIFGWSAIGVGGAAVIAGAVVGVIAAARYDALDCPDKRCPLEQAEEVAGYNDLRVPSGLTIFGGLLALGIGIPFVAIDVGGETAIAPVVGPGGIGLAGRF
jgi:hypothetical protein